MKKVLFISLSIFLIPISGFCLDITITLDDATAARVIDRFCDHLNYQDRVLNPSDSSSIIPNPVSKIQFFRRSIVDYIRGQAISEEAKNAARTAQDQALTKGQSEINITAR